MQSSSQTAAAWPAGIERSLWTMQAPSFRPADFQTSEAQSLAPLNEEQQRAVEKYFVLGSISRIWNVGTHVVKHTSCWISLLSDIVEGVINALAAVCPARKPFIPPQFWPVLSYFHLPPIPLGFQEVQWSTLLATIPKVLQEYKCKA